MARIAVLVDEPDWHTRRLVQALQSRGAVAAALSLRDCAFVLGERGSGIVMPGFEDALPDAVLVRAIAAGTFEQVTLRLGFLHALAALGVPVVNAATAIERCVDKSMTTFLLHHAGIPTPATLASESAGQAARWRSGTAAELVQKPLFGSQGRGLARIRADDPLSAADPYAGVHYLQCFVGRGKRWRDFRVMVIGGEPVAAMIRHGRSWVTNVKRGARCEAISVGDRLGALSVAAVTAVGADYAGVDLIEDKTGSLLVLEVNSMPAWKGLQSVTRADLATAIAEHVLARTA
jgi:tetrahydromethanopterin:alpha-L-glutamate ligase